MKTWENWSIDCGDKDESKVVISGSATSLDRVYINFESGADAGNYIITYNDGIRCITKTYTVAGAPCEIEWLGGTECITCDCICDNLVLNEASVDISKDGCSDMAIGSASDCITNIVTTTETWVRVNAVGEGLYLNVDANANSSRSTTVTFDYGVSCDSGKSCTKTLTVNQAGDSCGCGSITYEGTEEADPTPSEASITLSIYNGYSSSKQLGAFEIFTTEGSVQIGVDYQISAGETKNVTVDYTGFEGNTIYQVSGMVGGLSQCFSFTCPGGQCDLIDGDTLTVDIKNVINCT